MLFICHVECAYKVSKVPKGSRLRIKLTSRNLWDYRDPTPVWCTNARRAREWWRIARSTKRRKRRWTAGAGWTGTTGTCSPRRRTVGYRRSSRSSSRSSRCPPRSLRTRPWPSSWYLEKATKTPVKSLGMLIALCYGEKESSEHRQCSRGRGPARWNVRHAGTKNEMHNAIMKRETPQYHYAANEPSGSAFVYDERRK